MKNYKKPCDEELQKKLDEISYRVTQRNATEKPFSSPYNNNFQEGIYVDIVTGEPLFSSRDKFCSISGWPAFANPISDEAVKEFTDSSYGMERTEVRSQIGNSHLGHVFDDGPKEFGGRRYCINGAALKFISKANLQKEGYEEYISFFD